MSTSKHFKKYSSDFKLKVVLKYLSNNFTIAQICSEFNISKATLKINFVSTRAKRLQLTQIKINFVSTIFILKDFGEQLNKKKFI